MDDLKSKFINEDNFYSAFKKLNHYLRQSNEWYNPIELSEYEANLATNISRLKRAIEDGTYNPHPIEPLPFPKKNNKKNEERLRQYFRINIEDQLVWIAIVNVIARFIEPKMPFWSYGNRLFVPIWYEEENNKPKLKKGGYANASENLYRKWNQSWPFYRRHIAMTIKTMGFNSRFKIENLDNEIEKNIFLDEKESNWNEYKYLDNNFWKKGNSKKLFWSGLDYKKFFPSIKPEIVIQNIKKNIVRDNGEPRDDTELLFSTIEKMLRFPINKRGWENENVLLDKKNFGISDLNEYYGLPTGLLVSGFLSNIALIDVDEKVTKYIIENRNIAVFKFVDDQVILSKSKKDLLKFMNYYSSILSESNTGVEFQKEKICPENTFQFSSENKFSYDVKNEHYKDPSLDINFPEPLMTHTLQKMSNLNDEDYELLDSDELQKIESDLEHFLLADFPDAEMRRDTRMAFASFKLCQLAKHIKPDFKKLDKSYFQNILDAEITFNNYLDKTKYKDPKKKKIELDRIIENNIKRSLISEIKKTDKRFQKIFKLLLKSACENPDKLKLWKRCVEFCYITGFDGIKNIVKSIKDTDLHYEGKGYIQVYCVLILNEKIIQAQNQINVKNISYWKNYTSNQFLVNISKVDILEINTTINKPFAFETNINHKFIKSTIKFKNKEADTNYKSVFNFYITLKDEEKYLTFESFLWYILSITIQPIKLNLWNDNIEYINFKNKISWSIISLFPASIPELIIDKIKNIEKELKSIDDVIYENFEFRNRENGVVYEMFEKRPEIIEKYKEYYPKLEKILKQSELEYLPLNKWIEKVKNNTKSEKWIDVRLSEWTMLEIIKQIAEAIKKKKEEITIFNFESSILYFHPVNYLLPIKWASNNKITWDKWEKFVRKDENKIILNETELLIDDFRYLPIQTIWKTNGINWLFGLGDFSIIIGLSVLMTQLLSKSFDWPCSVNKQSFIDQLYSKALFTIETEPISSKTRMVLTKIFSKKDVNFFSGSDIIEIDKTTKIISLDSFITTLDQLQKDLIKDHLILLDNAPRQLTIIDIDVLNETKNIF